MLLRLLTLAIKKTETFSSLACHFVYWTGKYSSPIHPKHLLLGSTRWYTKYVKLNHRILDIGCHNGIKTITLAQKSHNVIGIDKDRYSLKQARLNAQRQNIRNISFLIHDVNKILPFKTNSFDCVFLLAVLEHLEYRDLALKEIHRVLKKNGYFFISVPNSDTTWKRWQRRMGLSSLSDPDHKIEYSKKNLTQLLKKRQFRILKMMPVAIDMPFVGFIDLIGGLSISIYRFLTLWRKVMVQRYPQESIAFQVVAQCLK